MNPAVTPDKVRVERQDLFILRYQAIRLLEILIRIIHPEL
jgi:hypothetical protein